MNRRAYSLAIVATLCAFALPAWAGVTFTTEDGATSPSGLPVVAQAEFALTPDHIVIRIKNSTENLQDFDQTLRGVTFQINHKRAGGELSSTGGYVRTFTADGLDTRTKAEPTKWTLAPSGQTFQIKSVGTERNIIADAKDGKYRYANESVARPGGHEYLAGTVVFEINAPGVEAGDDVVNVRFQWGKDEGLDGISRTAAGPTGMADPSHLAGGDAGTPGKVEYVPPQSGYPAGGGSGSSYAALPPMGGYNGPSANATVQGGPPNLSSDFHQPFQSTPTESGKTTVPTVPVLPAGGPELFFDGSAPNGTPPIDIPAVPVLGGPTLSFTGTPNGTPPIDIPTVPEILGTDSSSLSDGQIAGNPPSTDGSTAGDTPVVSSSDDTATDYVTASPNVTIAARPSLGILPTASGTPEPASLTLLGLGALGLLARRKRH